MRTGAAQAAGRACGACGCLGAVCHAGRAGRRVWLLLPSGPAGPCPFLCLGSPPGGQLQQCCLRMPSWAFICIALPSRFHTLAGSCRVPLHRVSDRLHQIDAAAKPPAATLHAERTGARNQACRAMLWPQGVCHDSVHHSAVRAARRLGLRGTGSTALGRGLLVANLCC